jgi:ATP-dependent RNA helicase DDX20
VAVGTTGRILSLIQRGALKTGSVRMLVLDEADKLLADSFRKDVLAIIEAVPPKRQLLALSATYAPAALQQLRGLMGGRQQEVLLCCEDTSLLAVRQCYRMLPAPDTACEGAHQQQQQQQQQQQAAAASEGGFGPHFEARLAALLSLLSSVSFQQAVVFCKYKTDAEEVAERLLAAGYPAAHLSAQRTQLQRIEALNALRDFRWVCWLLSRPRLGTFLFHKGSTALAPGRCTSHRNP